MVREKEKIAVVGCGNIGAAIIRGMASQFARRDWKVLVCDRNAHKVDDAKREFAVEGVVDDFSFLPEMDVVIVAVKPYNMSAVLTKMREEAPQLGQDVLFVSVAAGFSKV